MMLAFFRLLTAILLSINLFYLLGVKMKEATHLSDMNQKFASAGEEQ